ncbi:hypothetical protein AALO_G00259540 [Alosa alosa]|uniref:Arginine vasotocin receptor n=1 Tax=Alosa alosa TaxID=278164 RepID=A0AAV6FUJ6_9TELE|nr:hypothetical protein AALO_G00259540 [Alosa alosa]
MFLYFVLTAPEARATDSRGGYPECCWSRQLREGAGRAGEWSRNRSETGGLPPGKPLPSAEVQSSLSVMKSHEVPCCS